MFGMHVKSYWPRRNTQSIFHSPNKANTTYPFFYTYGIKK